VPFATVQPSFGGMPAVYDCVLPYSTTVIIAATTGADLYGLHVMRANGIYDPDYTVVGHQPLGRDLLAQRYYRYVVMRSTIEITPAINTTTTTLANVFLTLLPVTSFDQSSLTTVLEQGGTTSVQILPTAGQQPKTIARTYDPHVWFGMNQPSNNLDIGAAVSDNPIQQAYFVFGVGGVTMTTAQTAIQVRMLYHVHFFMPRELPGS